MGLHRRRNWPGEAWFKPQELGCPGVARTATSLGNETIGGTVDVVHETVQKLRRDDAKGTAATRDEEEEEQEQQDEALRWLHVGAMGGREQRARRTRSLVRLIYSDGLLGTPQTAEVRAKCGRKNWDPGRFGQRKAPFETANEASPASGSAH
jgi:hypothetical protein